MSSVGGAFNEQLLWSRLPSIFELFAQEAMATALQPAIEYVVKVNRSRDLHEVILQLLGVNAQFPYSVRQVMGGKR